MDEVIFCEAASGKNVSSLKDLNFSYLGFYKGSFYQHSRLS
ncbi:TPA: hypothetical protein ACJJY2_002713 [Enterobacter asburiae]